MKFSKSFKLLLLSTLFFPICVYAQNDVRHYLNDVSSLLNNIGSREYAIGRISVEDVKDSASVGNKCVIVDKSRQRTRRKTHCGLAKPRAILRTKAHKMGMAESKNVYDRGRSLYPQLRNAVPCSHARKSRSKRADSARARHTDRGNHR